MAKQTQVLQRPSKWRNIYFKIFKEFRDNKWINNFEPLKSLEGVHCFRIITIEARILYINFYKSVLINRVNIASENSNTVFITVGEKALPKNLSGLLHRYLKVLPKYISTGKHKEENFETKVNQILCRKNIISIIKTKGSDDIKGIDFYINYKNNLIPLQIKSRSIHQEIHREHFPLIPSLVYYPHKYSNEILKQTLISICELYLIKVILHK